MIDVSTKNSVKKGLKCEYTFFTGKEWLKVITKLDSTSKCTYYDDFKNKEGKVKALTDRLPDVGNVHSKCLPLNCDIFPELTRAPCSPKILKKRSTITVSVNQDKLSSFLHQKILHELMNTMENVTDTYAKDSHLFQLTHPVVYYLSPDLSKSNNCCESSHSITSKYFTYLLTGKYSRTPFSAIKLMCKLCKKCEYNGKLSKLITIKRHFILKFDILLNFYFCTIQKTLLNNYNHINEKFYNGFRKSTVKNFLSYKKSQLASFLYSKILKRNSKMRQQLQHGYSRYRHKNRFRNVTKALATKRQMPASKV
jgi:hypothetical protein